MKMPKPQPQKKKDAPRLVTTAVRYEPTHASVQVDLAFIADHLPKFRVKDLVVIAMAMGARVRLGSDANVLLPTLEFDFSPTPEQAYLFAEKEGKDAR